MEEGAHASPLFFDDAGSDVSDASPDDAVRCRHRYHGIAWVTVESHRDCAQEHVCLIRNPDEQDADIGLVDRPMGRVAARHLIRRRSAPLPGQAPRMQRRERGTHIHHPDSVLILEPSYFARRQPADQTAGCLCLFRNYGGTTLSRRSLQNWPCFLPPDRLMDFGLHV